MNQVFPVDFSNHLFIIIIAAGVFLLAIVSIALFFLLRKKNPNAIFLIGNIDSGKTALFYYLASNEFYPTVNSIKANETSYQVRKKVVKIVDLPGHPRTYTEIFSRLNEAGMVIFVIDSTTIINQINRIGDLLYDVLCIIEKRKVPLMILSSKIDKNGKQIDEIKSQLEDEINYVRLSKHQSSLIEKKEENVFLGDEEIEFTFEQLKNKIVFGECSVKLNDVAQVRKFIESNV